MELVSYLTQKGDVDAVDIQNTFGVSVRQEGDLYLFKYQQISAVWAQSLTHECRGVILRKEGSSFSVLSRPFDKFFNQAEGYCPLFEEGKFNASINDLEMHEKADGSCIQLWHDGDRWRASTLGTITPKLVGDENICFEQLFWQVSEINPEVTGLDRECTYLFELCSDLNRIVTKYPKDICVLLGIRHKETGEYAPLEGDMALRVCEGTNVRLPYRNSFRDLGIDSLNAAKEFVEKSSLEEDRYGKWPEGFVVYRGGAPVAKMKNLQYLTLHSVGGGDIKHSRNRIVEAYFEGKLDDFYFVLTDRLKAFADSLDQRVKAMLREVYASLREMKTSYPDQKSYALDVREKVPSLFQGFAFQHKDKVLEKSSDLPDLAETYLKGKYHRVDWKAQ